MCLVYNTYVQVVSKEYACWAGSWPGPTHPLMCDGKAREARCSQMLGRATYSGFRGMRVYIFYVWILQGSNCHGQVVKFASVPNSRGGRQSRTLTTVQSSVS